MLNYNLTNEKEEQGTHTDLQGIIWQKLMKDQFSFLYKFPYMLSLCMRWYNITPFMYTISNTPGRQPRRLYFIFTILEVERKYFI